MLMMFERMLQEQWTMTELGVATDHLIQRNGQFDGQDVSHYMRDYKVKMVCWVSEALRISTFSRIATNDLQEKIQELRGANTT
jgi:hypothetical protein